jgi:hypothetical protein
MSKITLSDLIDAADEFEVAPGAVVKLKRPTYKLRDDALALAQKLQAERPNDPRADLEFARFVTDGAWPADDDDCFPAVVVAISEATFRRFAPRRTEGR